jgi:hypothetical protein
MALIKCPECGKPVSDQTQNCPQCGYLITPTKWGWIILFYICGFFLFWLGLTLWKAHEVGLL